MTAPTKASRNKTTTPVVAQVEGEKMTATLDLTTSTPVEIDTILAKLDYEYFVAMIKSVDYRKAAHKARDYIHYDWRTRTSTPRPDEAKAL